MPKLTRRTALKSLAALPLVPLGIQEQRTPFFGLRPGEKFPTFEVHQTALGVALIDADGRNVSGRKIEAGELVYWES